MERITDEERRRIAGLVAVRAAEVVGDLERDAALIAVGSAADTLPIVSASAGPGRQHFVGRWPHGAIQAALKLAATEAGSSSVTTSLS